MKKIESGRSMIEMLGVLAIIGVLSIGGLAGYTMAMNRWRANTITDYVTRCVVVAQTKGVTGKPSTTSDTSGDQGVCSTILGEAYPGFITDAKITNYVANTDETTVTVTGISTSVQDVLFDKMGTRVNGVKFTKPGTFSFMNSTTS